MKFKILSVLIGATLLLTACGGQPSQKSYSSNRTSIDSDTVLWTNTDGTDCDYGDYLEGDKDCKKQTKKKFVVLPSASKIAKDKKSYVNSVKNKVAPKINIAKKKVDATKKTTSTFKKRTKSTSGWRKSSFSKSSSSKSSFKSSSTRKRR